MAGFHQGRDRKRRDSQGQRPELRLTRDPQKHESDHKCRALGSAPRDPTPLGPAGPWTCLSHLPGDLIVVTMVTVVRVMIGGRCSEQTPFRNRIIGQLCFHT